ncbi:MAG: serine/threonine protein kinase [Polyangiaceae bacterium]|nr:serine/threonine protein kinase [Polyangiaceae bacterium]
MAEQQRYRVIDRIAAGGMAEVYRAESAGLEGFKKKVAIKRVLPHLSEKKRFIQMFLDEARLGAHLSHSNCVQVFDVGVGDNTYFIVMEYVDGADLKAFIEHYRRQGRPVPVGHAVYITLKICEGLAYAHALSDETGKALHLVHRDLSPPNVLLTKFGEIKIVDFGLAKASTQLEKSEPGIIKGKFSYLSPEAAMGQEVDARTDIFAAGIILWEMLAGRKLFQGETDFETVKQVQRAESPPVGPMNREVDPALDAIIARGLARDPGARFQTAQSFAQSLTEWLFHTGCVVTPFEIAEVVQAIGREKSREKKAEAGINVIDRLIEQTLFEFTSLDEKAGSVASPLGNRPLDAAAGGGGMVDIQDWGSELGDLGSFAAPARKPAASINLEEGNLSRLEEDDRPASGRPPPGTEPPSSSATPLVTRKSDAGREPPAPLVEERRGSGGVVAIVVVAVAVLGAAGAYFGGLLK